MDGKRTLEKRFDRKEGDITLKKLMEKMVQ